MSSFSALQGCALVWLKPKTYVFTAQPQPIRLQPPGLFNFGEKIMERKVFHNSDKQEEPTEVSESAGVHAAMARQVDAVYDAMGARVIYGVSYAGEDPVQLYASPEQENDS